MNIRQYAEAIRRSYDKYIAAVSEAHQEYLSETHAATNEFLGEMKENIMEDMPQRAYSR